jgi:hypothetical protein
LKDYPPAPSITVAYRNPSNEAPTNDTKISL